MKLKDAGGDNVTDYMVPKSTYMCLACKLEVHA